MFPINELRNPMNNNISPNIGFVCPKLVPACPLRALVNIPQMKESTINNSAEMIPQTIIPINTFPTNCRQVRLLGSLNWSFGVLILLIFEFRLNGEPIGLFIGSSPKFCTFSMSILWDKINYMLCF